MSINLSEQKRNRLLNNIKIMREKLQEDPELLQSLADMESELKRKKYGLVWEEHEEKVDEELKTKIPVFVENKELEIQGDIKKPINFLLEGDNLHSLYLLEKTHKEAIDVIYIDPPYNTGNSFVYDDDIIDSNDSYKHSKWCSFMYERLQIAYKLLKDTGKIFISIDDNEQANLKLICNEIFGEENFFAQIVVQSNKRGQTYKQIAKTHEYIIIYTKSINAQFNEIKKSEEDSDLNLKDDISKFNVRELRNRNPKFGRFNRPNLYYPFYVNNNIVDKDGFSPVSLEKNDEFCIEVVPLNSKGEESCWRWGQKLSINNIDANTKKSNVVARIKKDGNYNVYEKYRKETYKAKTIWDDTNMITEKGTVELGEHGLAKLFEFPKPMALIKKCLELGSDSNSIVLDFFAGSGTTGQSVLEMNNEDDGNRSFILCTNNENNICENVTYKRLKNTIEGYSSKIEIKANLKYYKTEYIDRFKHEDEQYYIINELSKYIKELVQLENGIDIKDKSIQVLFTDEEIDEFSKNENLLGQCKILYVDTNALITDEQIELFEENRITVLYIPEYYFEDEILEVEQW